MIASLVLYALLGGADYGGGIWDLFAFGGRAKQQRTLIAKAIGPVWEANHVWIILVIVILFTAFPPAFAAIATALHIPITLLLIGIILRGTAFTFRTYDVQRDDVQRRWSLLFSIASIITPVLFVCAAVQVSLILLGWAFAQYPHLVEPDITIFSAAAPRITLQLLLAALVLGAVLLFPSYYYLFRIFKREPSSSE